MGVVVATRVHKEIGAVLGLSGLIFVGIFGIASFRASKAANAITHGPWARVYAVGWCRPPDGCNYAVFTRTPRPGDAPALVMRLPLRRQMVTATGWLCGLTQPRRFGAVALLSDDGALLGTGRIVSDRAAANLWRRHDTEPSRFVMKPPDDWLPPGGS
jgi:hypothetical protein